MSIVVGSLVYFLGPFGSAIVVHRLTQARWTAFLVGMPSFLLSQGLMSLLLVVLGLVGALFGPETIVVGSGLLWLALVPIGLLADVPGGADMQSAVIDRSTSWALVYALHRLLLGLLMHTT